jgi:hypothetical protein
MSISPFMLVYHNSLQTDIVGFEGKHVQQNAINLTHRTGQMPVY